MININKYNTLQDYLQSGNITYDECRVSQIGSSEKIDIIYKTPDHLTSNRVVTANMLGQDEVAMVVKDLTDGNIKFIPEDCFSLSKLDTSRYQLKSWVRYRGEGLKQLMIHKNATLGQWAICCYYRINHLGNHGVTVSTGGFAWDADINGSHPIYGIVSWRTRDTLQSICDQIMRPDNGVAIATSPISGVGIFAEPTKDGTGIGIAINSSSASPLYISENLGFDKSDVVDLSEELLYDGSVPSDYIVREHHAWQATLLTSLLPPSIVSELRSAYRTIGDIDSKSNLCREGSDVNRYAGANFARCKSYYKDTGSTDTAAAFDANEPLRESAFAGWSQTTYPTYDSYLVARMMDTSATTGVNALSNDNGQDVTRILGNITTTDYNGERVPAFPAAAAALSITYHDADLMGTGGNAGLPTAHQIGCFMCDRDPNRFSSINRAIVRLTSGDRLTNSANHSSSVEWSSIYAWIYNGTSGTLVSGTKYNQFAVRPALVYIP